MISAEVICDSINPAGCRLITVSAVYPRFIHAEVLTHRAFSRNAASSRAVPVSKMLKRVMETPAMPVHWGQNQRGMQAELELPPAKAAEAQSLWLKLRDEAVAVVERMSALGVHKQVANRLLEPWLHIQTLISATEWENFFKLRDHDAAQPEIQELAREIRRAIEESEPLPLREGQWHLPYIRPQDRQEYALETLVKISAARCARVSYYLHNGSLSDCDSDLMLFNRLAGAEPKHLSPLEHVCCALKTAEPCKNFRGWQQLRSFYEITKHQRDS